MNSKLSRAIKFASNKHLGQKTDAGGDFFTQHVFKVVQIVNRVTHDDDILCAACLHDVLEDTETTIEEIEEEFGPRVANLVFEVTKTGKNCFPNLKSPEAFIIKYADRLLNLATMHPWDNAKRERYLERSKFWSI